MSADNTASGMPTPREIIEHQGERAKALVHDIAETQRGIAAKCVDWEREAHGIATGIKAGLALLRASEAERRKPSGETKPPQEARRTAGPTGNKQEARSAGSETRGTTGTKREGENS